MSIYRFLKYGLPVFLFLCLVGGGSTQGVWANFALQIAAVLILVAVAVAAGIRRDNGSGIVGQLPWIGLALFLLVMIELVPLPPSVWTELCGRALVAQGFGVLNQAPPWLAWSLIPEKTVSTLVTLLVPIAIITTVVMARAVSPRLLAGAIITATVAGVLLGFLQVRDSTDAWYLYRFSAFGTPTGFFANSNHMGTLLLAVIPFLVALVADQLKRAITPSDRLPVLGGALALGSLLIVSCALNRSLAIMVLGAPVVLLSLFIPAWKRNGLRLGLVLSSAAFAAAIAFSASQGAFLLDAKEGSIRSRSDIWTNAVHAVEDFRYTGSGLGTFEEAYRLYENPALVDSTYVNHAHNDYIEVAVELGAPGLILIALFLLWWGKRALLAWRRSEVNLYARAASIASAAILVHSMVDYPLRTAAISAVFALCLGFLCIQTASIRSDGGANEV